MDLFCGAGGLSHGLQQAGIDVVAGIDADAKCRYAYEKNNSARFVLEDVGSLKAEDIQTFYAGADIRLLAGCAPCQPFSSYSQGGRARANDDRWRLLDRFSEIVGQIKPELLTMENVTGLRNHPIYARFIAHLQKLGYRLNATIMDGPSTGLPQTRKRLVLVASRLGWPEFAKIESADRPTVRAAIGSLPRLGAGQKCEIDRIHQATGMTAKMINRIKASRPGGTWQEWPKELVANCHASLERPAYVSVYGRMEWDEPSPTITTQFYGIGHGRFGHPEQDRAITPREAAILQGFGMNYEFLSPSDPFSFSVLGRLIGNAVPVTFGKLIGQTFQEHVRQFA